jgi:hypothetical protein
MPRFKTFILSEIFMPRNQMQISYSSELFNICEDILCMVEQSFDRSHKTSSNFTLTNLTFETC